MISKWGKYHNEYELVRGSYYQLKKKDLKAKEKHKISSPGPAHDPTARFMQLLMHFHTVLFLLNVQIL